MWGRDNKFQVSSMYELLNGETKISLIKLFSVYPLIYTLPNNLGSMYSVIAPSVERYFCIHNSPQQDTVMHNKNLSFFVLSPWDTFFSPRRGWQYHRVMEFCMGSLVRIEPDMCATKIHTCGWRDKSSGCA